MTEHEAREHLASAFTQLCRAIADDAQFSNTVANERGILTMSWLPTRTFTQAPSDE